jgi:hypothetical protein
MGRFFPVTVRDAGREVTVAVRDTVEGFSVRISGFPFSTGISRIHPVFKQAG